MRPSASSKWKSCIEGFNLPNEVLAVSDVTLQLVLEIIMQSIIQQ